MPRLRTGWVRRLSTARGFLATQVSIQTGGFIMARCVASMLVACSLFLTGCAAKPQRSVEFDPKIVSSQSTRIGVAMTAMPKVDTYLTGASCLLCYGLAALANSKLTDHAKTL